MNEIINLFKSNKKQIEINRCDKNVRQEHIKIKNIDEYDYL